ncbi:helix-turn-helix transcriptional regulator [Pseudomonas sp. LRF_L74]|uniref:helix-turn-helix transcriptional regulator n=1 Tax=Pseudomonas sp. LRF_L74 TaxID=3369422 RepID=UPI003F5D85CB
MALNQYQTDMPLEQALLSLADEELDIRLIAVTMPHDSKASARSEPSLTLAYYEQGGGWRQFADTAPMPFRDGSCCLYHSSVVVEGDGFLPAGVPLRGVNISFAQQILARLGVQDWLFDGSSPWEQAHSSDGLAHLLQFPAPHALRRIGLDILDCRLEGLARQLYLRGKALEMLAETLCHLQRQVQPQAQALGGRDQARLQRARVLLEERLDEAWTLDALAAAVELNVRKLKEGFRRLYGKGVYALLQDLRMQRAALRLQAGEKVADVALAVGYSNPSHFAKVFRRHHGVTPRDFGRT